jgi:hypothetical protein
VNIQKLGKKSKAVRGKSRDEGGGMRDERRIAQVE